MWHFFTNNFKTAKKTQWDGWGFCLKGILRAVDGGSSVCNYIASKWNFLLNSSLVRWGERRRRRIEQQQPAWQGTRVRGEAWNESVLKIIFNDWEIRQQIVKQEIENWNNVWLIDGRKEGERSEKVCVWERRDSRDFTVDAMDQGHCGAHTSIIIKSARGAASERGSGGNCLCCVYFW